MPSFHIGKKMPKKMSSFDIAEEISKLAKQLEIIDHECDNPEAALYLKTDQKTVGMAMLPVSARETQDGMVEILFFPVKSYSTDWADKDNPRCFLRLFSGLEQCKFTREEGLAHLRHLKEALHINETRKEFSISSKAME